MSKYDGTKPVEVSGVDFHVLHDALYEFIDDRITSLYEGTPVHDAWTAERTHPDEFGEAMEASIEEALEARPDHKEEPIRAFGGIGADAYALFDDLKDTGLNTAPVVFPEDQPGAWLWHALHEYRHQTLDSDSDDEEEREQIAAVESLATAHAISPQDAEPHEGQSIPDQTL